MDKQKISVHVAWMIRAHLPAVLEIEKASYAAPWVEDDFIFAMRRRCTVGMVAEDVAMGDERGYIIYELEKHAFRVLKLGVDPRFRCRGVGAALLRKLTGKLSAERRTAVTLEVSEKNLAAHLWLRACGFKAVGVDRARAVYCFAYNYVAPVLGATVACNAYES